ncbi:MAG: glycine zipper family protein [Carnobacterium sp.]|uniref:glycine zipper family protein n=1 Tax=Carnobacterium sp. TaxID=48221 RepID=UPI0033159E0F
MGDLDNNKEQKKHGKKTDNIPFLAIGISLGAAFGMLTDNLALGMGIGVAIGAALDSMKSKDKEK